MLPFEKLELAIFRWLARPGPRQWQGVSIPQLANAIDSHSAEVVEAFLGLWGRGAVQLRKWSGRVQDWVQLAGGREGEFFHQGDFQAMITPSGRPYFETIEQKERHEKQAETHGDELPLVFISCGQWTEEERDLGQKVTQLVDQMTGCRAYFAENQSSLHGLKENIFCELDQADGFIGIMHHRGEVSGPDGKHLRGSVWVEQEIAIAAFLEQMREREAFPVAVYLQKGIRREGVRQLLHLNEVEFEQPEEVIDDLRKRIHEGRFQVALRSVGVHLTPEIQCRKLSPQPASYEYELRGLLRNLGTETAQECWFEVSFPRALVGPYIGLLPVGGTDNYIVLRASHNLPIAPGGQPVPFPLWHFTLDPAVQAIADEVGEVTVGAPGMKAPRRDRKRIRDLILLAST